MNNILEREAILPRMDGMRKNLKKLAELSKLSIVEFTQDDPYDLAQHHLRLALEGVFHISSHILSRMPGGRATEYKDIARKMGEMKLVPRDFADKKLVAMAGMRNILVHHYAGIEAKRLHGIIKNHRQDIDAFLKHVKTVVEHPEKHGLRMN